MILIKRHGFPFSTVPIGLPEDLVKVRTFYEMDTDRLFLSPGNGALDWITAEVQVERNVAGTPLYLELCLAVRKISDNAAQR
jgi:hypothetical protein